GRLYHDRGRAARSVGGPPPGVAARALTLADAAHAVEVYARRQQLGDAIITHATAMKIDALTMLGEFLKKSPTAPGGDGQRPRFRKGTESPPTLAELGVTKKLAAASQALAELKKTDAALHAQIRGGGKSIALAARVVARGKKAADLEARAARRLAR